MRNPRITTVIATSPVPRIPDIAHIRRTLESLAFVPELNESPIIVSFDAARAERAREAYAQYQQNVAAYCGGKPNVRLLHLAEWGHLSGVMERAIQAVTTPFLFVQQHDLPLIRSFALDKVLKCLESDAAVKHVRLNHRHNRPVGWDRTPLFGAYDTEHLSLTRTGCWSDQSHLTTLDYYATLVIPAIRGRRTFPESILNPMMNVNGAQLPLIHAKFGTFIYGPPGEAPVIAHTNARMDRPTNVAVTRCQPQLVESTANRSLVEETNGRETTGEFSCLAG